MKFVLVAVTLIGAASVYGGNKFSGVDLDKILNDDNLLNVVHKCLLDGVGCSPKAEELRKILPTAVANGCANCSEKERNGAKKVASFLIKEKPELWKPLIAKYDPDRTYRQKFKEQLRAEGFNVGE